MAKAATASSKTRAALKADKAALHRLYHDPAVFARLLMDRELWAAQRMICRAVLNSPRPRVAVRSGHQVGKSALAAQCAIQWVLSRPQSIVITTAPTNRQVEKILWKEIGILSERIMEKVIRLPSGQKVAAMRPKSLLKELRLGTDWFAMGLSTSQPEAFQGIHSPGGVLTIIDEASGVDDVIYDAVGGMTGGKNDGVLLIGNPTRSSGFFYQIFRHPKIGQGWTTFHIDCERTPWILAAQPPPAPGLCTAEWIAEKRAEWGEDSARYRVRVKGEFDERSDRLLLSLDEVRKATRIVRPTNKPAVTGVDVGWTGDLTAITRIHGDRMTHIEKHHNKDPMRVVAAVIKFDRENPSDMIVVDANGIGAGVYSRLREQKLPAYPFYGSGKPFNESIYHNLRAESYHLTAVDIHKGLLQLVADDELEAQLAYIPYDEDSTGRLILESKKDMLRHGFASPDVADSLTMARYGQRLWVRERVTGGRRMTMPKVPGEFMMP